MQWFKEGSDIIMLLPYEKDPKKTITFKPVFLDRFCQHKWNRWIKWVTICLLNSAILLQIKYGVQMNSKGFIWWLFPLLWPSSKKFAFVFRNTETCIYRTFHSDCTKIGNIYTYLSESENILSEPDVFIFLFFFKKVFLG